MRLGDQLRENSTALFAMRQNGILTLLTKDPKIQRKELSQDVFIQKKEVPYPILQREAQYKLTKPSKFLIILRLWFAQQLCIFLSTALLRIV